MFLKVLKVLGYVAAVPALLLAFNGAMHLMSAESDLAVIGGYMILVGIGMTVYLFAARAYRFLSAKYMALAAICLCCSLLTGCYKIVEPGHAGLLVKQTGGERGVQDYPIQSGRVFYNPINEDVLTYPTSIQRAIWTKSISEGKEINEELSFQSKEGLHFTADVNCSYELERDKVPHFYVRFRNDDIQSFTHGFLRDTVRNSFDLATEYTAEQINGEKQGELIRRIGDKITATLTPIGVHVVQVGFAAPPRPPDQVRTAIENKIAAIQQAEQVRNQVQSSLAEGDRMRALANAAADSNRITNASLTPQLIQWEQIKKWDGKLPQVTGGGAIPMFNVK